MRVDLIDINSENDPVRLLFAYKHNREDVLKYLMSSSSDMMKHYDMRLVGVIAKSFNLKNQDKNILWSELEQHVFSVAKKYIDDIQIKALELNKRLLSSDHREQHKLELHEDGDRVIRAFKKVPENNLYQQAMVSEIINSQEIDYITESDALKKFAKSIHLDDYRLEPKILSGEELYTFSLKVNSATERLLSIKTEIHPDNITRFKDLFSMSISVLKNDEHCDEPRVPLNYISDTDIVAVAKEISGVMTGITSDIDKYTKSIPHTIDFATTINQLHTILAEYVADHKNIETSDNVIMSKLILTKDLFSNIDILLTTYGGYIDRLHQVFVRNVRLYNDMAKAGVKVLTRKSWR